MAAGKLFLPLFTMSSPTIASEALDAAVVFTGRGGSGTRLLSQLAEEIGVFIGNRVNRSGDSIEWVDLVYRLAVGTAASAELPTGSLYRRELRARAAAVLDGSPAGASAPWGLKLPEAMLVLPLLVDAFARAKVVHMTRHPVASSLRRTHMTSRLNNAVGAATLPNAYRYSKRDVGAIASDEPYLHNACSWNYQVSRVLRYGRESLGPARYLELRYEDVCMDPSPGITRVRALLGRAAGGRPGSVSVDPSRMGGWDARDPRVEMVWKICGETAALLGYSRTPPAPSAEERD